MIFKRYLNKDCDFSFLKYKVFLNSFQDKNYIFQTFNDFIKEPKELAVVLRHDVDLLPQNSLIFAKIQNELGIKGTYYFRAVPASWDENIISQINELGHEIGYHYENLSICKGNIDRAMDDFKINLDKLREIAPVSTICMHGSPLSKFDSKDLWKEFNYKDYGIIAEPYFDVNFDEVFYLTDTGRRWDGSKVSVRDKVKTSFKLSFHTTDDIIEAVQSNKLPNQIMFTFHPQRWHDSKLLWTKELFFQITKNLIKRIFFVKTSY